MIVKMDFIYTPNGGNRPLHIYLPEGYGEGEKRYPVTYFFDGHNLFFNEDATYGKSWGLKEFLDDWEKDMIVVGIECGHGSDERLCEYLPYPAETGHFATLNGIGEKTFQWIIDVLKPYIDEHFRTIPFRECTAIAGSSMGGLMALYGVVHHNRWFSKGGCISSAIGFCMGALMEDITKCKIDPDTRAYLSWGSREARNARDPEGGDIVSDTYYWNKRVAEALDVYGATTMLRCQAGAGHCEADWEKLVPEFMDFLWMR